LVTGVILDLGNNISVSLAYPDGSGAIAVPVLQFDAKDAHLASDGLSKTTGTLVIPASPVDAPPEPLDPLVNPARFARGCRVIVQIKDNTGATVMHPRGRLRILKPPAPPVGRAPVLEIEVGCLLALQDYRQPPSDDSGVRLGETTTRTVLINRLAAKVGIGELQDAIAEFPLNYPVPTEQSYVATMGVIAWDAGYVLWIDSAEQLRARKVPSDPAAPDLRVQIGKQEVEISAIAPDETPAERVRAVGVAPEVKEVTNPPPVFSVAADAEFDPSEISSTVFTGFGTSAIATFTNVRQPKGRLFPQQYPGSKTLVYSMEEDNFTYYDDEPEGLLRKKRSKVRQPRGIVFPGTDPGNTGLIDSKEIEETYTYVDDATIRIDKKTYEPAAIVLGWAPDQPLNTRAYGMKLSEWETQFWYRQGRGWIQFSKVRKYKPGESSRASTNYSSSGDTQPPSPERRAEPNEGEEKQFVGEARFPPVAGSSFQEADREYEVRYPVSNAHCEEVARREGALLHGRQARINWVLPLRQRFLANYQPLMVIDWIQPNGTITRHLADGVSFVHEPRRGVVGGDSINLGQVKRRSPPPPTPPADGVSDPDEYLFHPYAESATLKGAIALTGTLFAPGYALEEELEFGGVTTTTGILQVPDDLTGTIEINGELLPTGEDMREAPLTIPPEGMVLEWLSSTQIRITAGRCVYPVNGETYRAVAVNPSNYTKSINATWAEGGAGGRVGGALAANTTYHVFAIVNAAGGVDFMFDTSVTGANAPSGYLSRRRIGSVITDGSSNIRRFEQVGHLFTWAEPVTDFSGTVPTSTENLQALTVPAGIRVEPILRIFANQHGQPVRIASAGLPTTNVGTAANHTGLTDTTVTQRPSLSRTIATNTSRQIRFWADGSITIGGLSIYGWVDPLY
jgi:hypothetical protein